MAYILRGKAIKVTLIECKLHVLVLRKFLKLLTIKRTLRSGLERIQVDAGVELNNQEIIETISKNYCA